MAIWSWPHLHDADAGTYEQARNTVGQQCTQKHISIQAGTRRCRQEAGDIAAPLVSSRIGMQRPAVLALFGIRQFYPPSLLSPFSLVLSPISVNLTCQAAQDICVYSSLRLLGFNAKEYSFKIHEMPNSTHHYGRQWGQATIGPRPHALPEPWPRHRAGAMALMHGCPYGIML